MSLDRWIEDGFAGIDRQEYERSISSRSTGEAPVTHHAQVCESHACRHAGKVIQYTLDEQGRIVDADVGTVFTPSGVRHNDCPDPLLAQHMKERR